MPPSPLLTNLQLDSLSPQETRAIVSTFLEVMVQRPDLSDADRVAFQTALRGLQSNFPLSSVASEISSAVETIAKKTAKPEEKKVLELPDREETGPSPTNQAGGEAETTATEIVEPPIQPQDSWPTTPSQALISHQLNQMDRERWTNQLHFGQRNQVLTQTLQYQSAFLTNQLISRTFAMYGIPFQAELLSASPELQAAYNNLATELRGRFYDQLRKLDLDTQAELGSLRRLTFGRHIFERILQSDPRLQLRLLDLAATTIQVNQLTQVNTTQLVEDITRASQLSGTTPTDQFESLVAETTAKLTTSPDTPQDEAVWNSLVDQYDKLQDLDSAQTPLGLRKELQEICSRYGLDPAQTATLEQLILRNILLHQNSLPALLADPHLSQWLPDEAVRVGLIWELNGYTEQLRSSIARTGQVPDIMLMLDREAQVLSSQIEVQLNDIVAEAKKDPTSPQAQAGLTLVRGFSPPPPDQPAITDEQIKESLYQQTGLPTSDESVANWRKKFQLGQAAYFNLLNSQQGSTVRWDPKNPGLSIAEIIATSTASEMLGSEQSRDQGKQRVITAIQAYDPGIKAADLAAAVIEYEVTLGELSRALTELRRQETVRLLTQNLITQAEIEELEQQEQTKSIVRQYLNMQLMNETAQAVSQAEQPTAQRPSLLQRGWQSLRGITGTGGGEVVGAGETAASAAPSSSISNFGSFINNARKGLQLGKTALKTGRLGTLLAKIAAAVTTGVQAVLAALGPVVTFLAPIILPVALAVGGGLLALGSNLFGQVGTAAGFGGGAGATGAGAVGSGEATTAEGVVGETAAGAAGGTSASAAGAGTAQNPVGGVGFGATASPAYVGVGGTVALGATAAILTSINHGAFVVPLPTIGADGEVSPYVTMEKVADPGIRFENEDLPLNITYTITIRADLGYDLIITELSDRIIANYNTETRPDKTNPTEIVTRTAEELLPEGLILPLSIPAGESITLRPYTENFSDDFRDSNVINTVDITFSAENDEEFIESETASTFEVICFGECPQTQGCWPSSGVLTQFPYNQGTHRGQDGFDIGQGLSDATHYIWAPFSGTVTIPEFMAGGYGNYVVLQADESGGGNKFAFAHMRVVASDLYDGMQVEAGHVLGIVGTTGRSSGNHLHYEMANPDGNFYSYPSSNQWPRDSRIINFVPEGNNLILNMPIRSCYDI